MSADDETKSKAPLNPTVEDAPADAGARELVRRDSQTASEWVNSQLKLEAEAREALPYSFDNCTRPLGSLRQNVFACLTCHPPPATANAAYAPAGMCYGCSISCHGEHTLVEIFARRNFTCDCGTTRFGADTPCTLRVNAATGHKGDVHGEAPDAQNEYNHNFRNRFCGCDDWYIAQDQRGTMYQCLGLVSEADGGCGEDWWHPECLLNLPRDWYKTLEAKKENERGEDEGDEHPIPPGFPDEDDFSSMICYKCVDKVPWLKTYANSKGFLTLTWKNDTQEAVANQTSQPTTAASGTEEVPAASTPSLVVPESLNATKRKAEDSSIGGEGSLKRARTEEKEEIGPSSTSADPISQSQPAATSESSPQLPKHAHLPPAPSGIFSLLTTSDDWRDQFCRCASCYPRLSKYPPLLEEEETYQPPLSSDGGGDGESQGTGSLLDRGEAALNNMDRVRAIEGVMAYNHVRDKVKAFLAPFAQSGRAVGAKDVEDYFAKLRGDDEAIREAGRKVKEEGTNGGHTDAEGGSGGDGGSRKEQSGY